ncbi:hypothetical protein IF1G_03398 [Cordyceps javanica]|uniref:Uncharacterized protein n=1 Tax=Cordyceps javanica TaxID=43265 RepID=A0A545V7J1_9HYPO|nr:hypothetical protein IF1G_03398 [Cordyceps javanica]
MVPGAGQEIKWFLGLPGTSIASLSVTSPTTCLRTPDPSKSLRSASGARSQPVLSDGTPDASEVELAAWPCMTDS